MHNLNDKHPTRQGFEPGTGSNETSEPAIEYRKMNISISFILRDLYNPIVGDTAYTKWMYRKSSLQELNQSCFNVRVSFSQRLRF